MELQCNCMIQRRILNVIQKMLNKIEPAGPGQARPSRTEPGRAGRAGFSRKATGLDGPSQNEPGRPGRAEPSLDGTGRAGPS